MQRLYLLGSAAIIGLTVLGGSPTFGHGGGHGHGGHSHSSHSHGHASGGHHTAAHHSAPSHAAHAHVAGHHSTANHSFVQNGHSWHHHGWSNGYWGNGYWGNFGNGYVAPGFTTPWYYDQFWSTVPETVIVPGAGAVVTSEYMNNVIRPASPLSGPADPVEPNPNSETPDAP
jgi:hypothetical protein